MTTLKHAGVLGMKWGHHKPKEKSSISSNNSSDREIVRKKGETVQHVTGNDKLNLSKDVLYTSFTKKDVLRYRGEYADQVRATKNIDKVLSYKLTATKDLVSPSKKKRIDELIALSKDEKATLTNLAKTNLDCGLIMQTAKALGFRSVEGDAAKYRKQLLSNDPKEQEKAYRDFVKIMPLSDKLRTSYVSRLEKQGFNSMYDDNDMFAGYSDKPLIVFDSVNNLKIKSKHADMPEDTDKVFAELEKLVKETE